MEERKTRRRPNFFDILFLVLILLVAAAAWLVSHNFGQSRQQVISRSYTVEITDLQADAADYVSPGDTVTDNVKNLALGQVTAVEVQPSRAMVLDEAAGIYREAPREGRITLVLTIQADTLEDQDSVDTVSGYTLRTGTAVSCTAGQLSGSGYILSVERKEG